MTSDYMIAKNPHQGAYKKALFVCSAGILRSATAAHWAAEHKGWNTRNVGVHDYALIPLTQDLIDWADKIYCMEQHHVDVMRMDFGPLPEDKIKVLNIPDNYEYRSPELIELLAEKLAGE